MRSTRGRATIKEKVLSYLRGNGIPPRAGVLVAVSGGPDSTALLHALVQLGDAHPLMLSCAYLDHGLRDRGEIEQETQLVGRLCARLGVSLTVESLPHGALRRLAARSKRSLEEAAREKRYAYLRACADRDGSHFIALGHTADDQVETLIMRFFQGADVTGLAGIPARRGRIIRPLIACSREEVLDYLRGLGAAYCTDSSNLSTEHLRNKVRLKLLPAIEEVFPGCRGSLAGAARRMAVLGRFLEQEASARLVWERVAQGCRLPAGAWLSAPAPLRILSAYRIWNRLFPRGRRIPGRFFAPLMEAGQKPDGGTLLRGYGVRLVRQGEFLIALRDIVCPGEKGYFIAVKQGRKYIIGKAGLSVWVSDPALAGDEEQLQLDKSVLEDPIIVRSRKAGDRIRLPEGTKQLKKLFSEWKVPRSERWKIPILADGKGIVAVLGKRLGYRNRFRLGLPRNSSATGTIGVRVSILEET